MELRRIDVSSKPGYWPSHATGHAAAPQVSQAGFGALCLNTHGTGFPRRLPLRLHHPQQLCWRRVLEHVDAPRLAETRFRRNFPEATLGETRF
eukprot:5110349-Prymnesium_polylepis.1